MILIRSAAELTSIAEATRAELLAGKATVSVNDVIRSENAMARAIRALAIPSPVATEDFADMMRRLAIPQEGAGEADAPDPVISGRLRRGGEMLPADGVS
jgi:hypothetical protein